MKSLIDRRMFCWLDRWIDMTIEEARQFEKSVAEELVEVLFSIHKFFASLL